MAKVTVDGFTPSMCKIPPLRTIKLPSRKLYCPPPPLGWKRFSPWSSVAEMYLNPRLGRLVGMLALIQSPASNEIVTGTFMMFVVKLDGRLDRFTVTIF